MSRSYLGRGMTSQRTRDRLVERLRMEGVSHGSVLQVMRELPRHIFVDEALASRAYEDTALPIGHSQTISQPYIVARMTEVLLGETCPANVLEVGTGCGYQTAVLARLVPQVYSVERIGGLLVLARERMHALGLSNVRLKHADGNVGWPENAPFEGIIVTAAPAVVPGALLEQLALGGRMVIPVGATGEQHLWRITRTNNGYVQEMIERVSFVPMLGGTG